jgi:NAD(P)H dehydrogenase (quinone)
MSQLLIINGHPSRQSFNAELSNAYDDAASGIAATAHIALADLSFDPILHHGYAKPQALEPDLVTAADAIQRAQHVTWVFPTWWNGPPALLKGFIDRVFLPGYAFKYDTPHGLPRKLLQGRSARFISTMDSPRAWHWLVNRNAVETAFGRSTLRFVGFAPVLGTMFYSVGKMDRAARDRAIQDVQALGRRDARALRTARVLPILPRQVS